MTEPKIRPGLHLDPKEQDPAGKPEPAKKSLFHSLFFQGLKAGLPVVLGYVPIGIAYGMMARQAGLSVTQTIFMSATVYAGASQMMAAGMYQEAASLGAIILATFILNLRHLIMSACVMHQVDRAPLGLRLLGAFGITDEVFAVFSTSSEKQSSIWFLLGLVSGTYLAWVTGSAVGAFASGLLPPIVSASFGIALYAMFIALLVPGLKGNLPLAFLVLLSAGMNTIFCQVLPSGWALIAATLISAGVGTFFVHLPDESSPSAPERASRKGSESL